MVVSPPGGSVTREDRSASPDGRYIVGVEQLEVRAFQWVDTPQLVDRATDLTVLELTDPCWHLDSADWRSAAVVTLRLRHFPDGLQSYDVTVDCGQLTASVDGGETRPLAELDEVLAAATRDRTR